MNWFKLLVLIHLSKNAIIYMQLLYWDHNSLFCTSSILIRFHYTIRCYIMIFPLNDVYFKPNIWYIAQNIFVIFIFEFIINNIFKIPSIILKTWFLLLWRYKFPANICLSSKRLEDVFNTYLGDVFKTSST